jgi:hypothetical protein
MRNIRLKKALHCLFLVYWCKPVLKSVDKNVYKSKKGVQNIFSARSGSNQENPSMETIFLLHEFYISYLMQDQVLKKYLKNWNNKVKQYKNKNKNNGNKSKQILLLF